MSTLLYHLGKLVDFRNRYQRASQTKAIIRFVQPNDIPALLDLEHAIWEPNQAASATDMRERMQTYPDFCAAVFCPHTGQALASVFARPTHHQTLVHAPDWYGCVMNNPLPQQKNDALFGISLTSRNAEAAKAVFEFLWPITLKYGLKEWYLGSPMPGLRDWMNENLQGNVETYARGQHKGLPRDRQLRYYSQRGFPTLVAVKPNYFPHAESLDYGALISGKIPLHECNWLWQRLPIPMLQRLSKLFFVIL